MSLHETPGRSDEWYTPPYVFEAMDSYFFMDVASPGKQVTPWVPAQLFLTENSLATSWTGCVWMNAPFGGRNGLVPWLEKFMQHGNGVALTPDRTSCPWWQTYAAQADEVLFVAGKIKFIPGPGAKASSPAQGTTLFAKGPIGVQALKFAQNRGLGLIL